MLEAWGHSDSLFTEYFKICYRQSCIAAERNRDYNFWVKSLLVKGFRYLTIAQFLFLAFLTIIYSSPVWIHLLNSIFSTKYSLTVPAKVCQLIWER